MTAHTITEALDRFELTAGTGSEKDGKACVATALAWVNGDAWSDDLPCANRLLRSIVIRVNDADGTIPGGRQALVRAGEHGLLDTWWVPDIVVLWLLSQGDRELDHVAQTVDLLQRVAAWKPTKERPTNLVGASLDGANLDGARLDGARLVGASLVGANLDGARLVGASGDRWTRLPAGWKVDDSGLIVRVKS